MDESEGPPRPVPEAPTPEVYKKRPGESGPKLKRSIPDYLWPGQIGYDEILPRLPFLNRFFKTQKGTLEHGEKRGLTRRQFFVTVINGAFSLGYLYAAERVGKSVLIDNLMNPAVTGEGIAIESEESALVYLLDGASSDPRSDGVNVLAKDIAIASLGINSDNQKPVNFIDRSSWGHSELNVYFRSMDQFFTDILTTSGRENLRKVVNRKNGSHTKIDLDHISQFESYLTNNHLPNNASAQDLQTYFTTSKENKGLGYTADQWNLIKDTLQAYRNSNLTPALKDRINKVNEQSGTSFRIP